LIVVGKRNEHPQEADGYVEIFLQETYNSQFHPNQIVSSKNGVSNAMEVVRFFFCEVFVVQ
jgi:hypothetical protein